MLSSFFVVGGLAFWCLVAVVSILLLVALDRDSGWGAFWATTIFVAALTLWGPGVAGFKWAIANPTYIAGGIGVYLLAGTIWGVAKWALKVRKLARECKDIYQARRVGFLREHPKMAGEEVNEATPVPVDLQPEWIKCTIHTYKGNFFQVIDRDKQGKIVAPRARDYKSSILLWMAFWPVSAIWTVLDDLVKEVFENIYQFLSTWLQSIADKAFAGIIGAQAADFQGAEAVSEDLVISEKDGEYPSPEEAEPGSLEDRRFPGGRSGLGSGVTRG